MDRMNLNIMEKAPCDSREITEKLKEVGVHLDELDVSITSVVERCRKISINTPEIFEKRCAAPAQTELGAALSELMDRLSEATARLKILEVHIQI